MSLMLWIEDKNVYFYVEIFNILFNLIDFIMYYVVITPNGMAPNSQNSITMICNKSDLSSLIDEYSQGNVVVVNEVPLYQPNNE